MNLEMRTKLKEYQQFIESYMDRNCFCYENEPQKVLFEAMRYSLLAGGKRLRPVFVFDFCCMCGGDWKSAVNFAAAVEMVHTYSLIHDDLPCMDNDDYRRGRLTNHKVYGEANAVLAGDALLTAAFAYIAKAPFDPRTRIEAVEILAECAGELGMVGGQVLDMMSEQRQCSEQEVVAIQSRKTGALIKAACKMGVLAGGGSYDHLRNAAVFAEHLGLAFQIRDDMLDVIGNAEELGKAVGVDTVKNTFVQLYGLEKCEELVRTHTNLAKNCLEKFEKNDFMSALSDELVRRTA